MSDSNKYVTGEPISIANLIRNLQKWFFNQLAQWKTILIGAFIIGGLFLAYQTFKKTNYTAETKFVLETESGGGLGQFSSLASLAGVNLGSLNESSNLFQIDNIVELYKSYTMMKETLLTSVDSELGPVRLITWYGQEAKYIDKWEAANVNFEIPQEQMLVRHDSVLKEVVEDILERNLDVSKPNRKLSILRVAYTSADEKFAKDFNEVLVRIVNDHYLEVKTKKTGKNLAIIKRQADSVKRVLDSSMEELARFQQEHPNLNPLRAQAMVPMQKIQIDLKQSTVVYQELVKNLEIAKVAHRNNTPLIELVDRPIFPLEDDQMKWYKAIVIGLFAGGILMVVGLTIKGFYRDLMKTA